MTARGASLPELFQNAGLGLMSILVDQETARPGGIRERIRAEGPDRETLLVDSLNQILFLFNVQQMVLCRFEIQSISEERALKPKGKASFSTRAATRCSAA